MSIAKESVVSGLRFWSGRPDRWEIEVSRLDWSGHLVEPDPTDVPTDVLTALIAWAAMGLVDRAPELIRYLPAKQETK